MPLVHRSRILTGLGGLVLAVALLPPSPGATFEDTTFDAERACPPDEVPRRFADVAPPHGPAADCLAWHGIAAGTTPTSYAPTAAITRAQTASLAYRFLERLEDLELPAAREGAFADVTDGPHMEAIETLTELDPPVVRGFEDGRFRPGSEVTRGQVATMLTLALDTVSAQHPDLGPLPEASSPYTDTAGSVHEETISRLAGAGIVVGYGDGSFRPGAPVTRGELATMLARVLGGAVEAGLLELPERAPRPDLSVSVTLTEVARMSSPTAGAVGPDGTLYLAERAGTVHPLGEDGIGAAVVDISDRTTTDGERGLLGLAFSADGSELYLSSTDPAGDTLVEAFAVDDGDILASERRTVFTLDQPRANHNGGQVKIGPDGLLYLGLGDGGGRGDPDGAGQDLSTALGSLVRIDPRSATPYAVPDDNPFVDRDDAVDEIFAYGLRNPWRFSFDRDTGDLWIADVGQNEREEVNWAPVGRGAGANYGWNLMEGTREFAGPEPDDHVPPVYEYATRGPEGCAITGGYVYRGAAIDGLAGAYLYSDYCEGLVRGLVLEDGAVVEQGGLGISGSQVVSFAEDADGELYLLDFGGSVQRIDPA
jgi:glucose/arabinose dehydrogenase